MTTHPQELGTVRDVKSPFVKVIAAHYEDGPTEGFLQHSELPDACVFQLLDWDRETDLRVYEVALITGTSFERIVEELFLDKRPVWPLWLLPGTSRARAEQLVAECFKRSRPLATVTTDDLLDDIAVWDAAQEAPASSGVLQPARQRRPDID